MRQILLGQAPLGQGGAVGSKPRFLGPPYYLVNDTFTTERVAGAINDTYAEPGPGFRDVLDSSAVLSLSGGNALTVAAAGSGSPACRYGGLARRGGQIARISVTLPTSTSHSCRAGWGGVGGSYIGNDCVGFFANHAIGSSISGSAGPGLGTWEDAETYEIASIQRTSGGFLFIRDGVFTNWTMLWHYTAGTGTPRSPMIATSASSSAGYTAHFIRVPAAIWLPTPLVSDGFSAWGTSDGLGHAEGIAGGLGAGGGGATWVDAIGTWGASGGAAVASALSGGIAAATVDSGKTDTITTAKVARSGGVAGVMVAYVDADNHVRAVHNGTNAQLIKRVSGSDTDVISAAATYVAGAEIRVIRTGTAYRLYYNNVIVGSEATISDAVFDAVSEQGIYTTDTGNTLDDFTVFARGSEGEYAALDDF